MLQIQLTAQLDAFLLSVKASIPTNSIIGLFGASGSGKSLLIRQLAGFDQNHCQNSQIKFDQICWVNSEEGHFTPVQQRAIGYLPQSYDLFPHLNVNQNITFASNNNPDLNNKQLTDIVITALDIGELSKRKPHQLSGGQRQRVALARAILSSSQLLLLDEPFSAIGEDHLGAAMRLLKTLKEDFGRTIIIASHNRIEHAFLDDYILTLRNGSIEQSGNYREISTDIEGRFCRTSNAVNHLVAKVETYHQKYSLNQLSRGEHTLWAGESPMKNGTPIVLEIHAQDISLFVEKNTASSMLNSLPVTIVSYSELTGHQLLIKLALDDDFLTTFITKKSFEELGLTIGMSLYACFKAVSVISIKHSSKQA
jgi:molybdate transport system ATP-binding protein